MSDEFPEVSDSDRRLFVDPDNIPDVAVKTAIVLPDGKEGWLHVGGDIRNDMGQFLVKPANAAPTITSDNAHLMLDRREEVKLEAIEAEITKGGRGNHLKGIQRIAKVQYDIATDPGSGLNATRSADWLMKHGGYSSGLQGSLQNTPNTIINVLIAALKPHMQGMDDDEPIDVVVE